MITGPLWERHTGGINQVPPLFYLTPPWYLTLSFSSSSKTSCRLWQHTTSWLFHWFPTLTPPSPTCNQAQALSRSVVSFCPSKCQEQKPRIYECCPSRGIIFILHCLHKTKPKTKINKSVATTCFCVVKPAWSLKTQNVLLKTADPISHGNECRMKPQP